MTNAQRDELLLNMNQHMLEMDQHLLDLNQRMLDMDQHMHEMDQKITNIDQRVSNLETDMAEQKEYTKRISGSVAVIEKEHGERIQILLDMVSEFSRKFESNNSRFDSQDKRLDNHTFRIMKIENKVGIS